MYIASFVIHGFASSVLDVVLECEICYPKRSRKSLLVNGYQNIAFQALLQLVETLRFNVKFANKEDEEWNIPFTSLREEYLEH